MGGATLAEIEDLLSDSLLNISDTKSMVQTMLTTQTIIAESQKSMALATESIARTFEKLEERQRTLEETNKDLYRNKGIAPNIFFLVTGTLCSVIVLGAVWLTDTSIKATLTSFEAGKKQLESSLKEAKTDIINEVKHGN